MSSSQFPKATTTKAAPKQPLAVKNTDNPDVSKLSGKHKAEEDGKPTAKKPTGKRNSMTNTKRNDDEDVEGATESTEVPSANGKHIVKKHTGQSTAPKKARTEGKTVDGATQSAEMPSAGGEPVVIKQAGRRTAPKKMDAEGDSKHASKAPTKRPPAQNAAAATNKNNDLTNHQSPASVQDENENEAEHTGRSFTPSPNAPRIVYDGNPSRKETTAVPAKRPASTSPMQGYYSAQEEPRTQSKRTKVDTAVTPSTPSTSSGKKQDLTTDELLQKFGARKERRKPKNLGELHTAMSSPYFVQSSPAASSDD
jgi:hypothetical protein